ERIDPGQHVARCRGRAASREGALRLGGQPGGQHLRCARPAAARFRAADKPVSLRLRSDNWAAGLRPEIGGCLAALACGGVEVLRTMPPGATHPLESACFPLVPWCNRIRDARFEWRGREVSLPANFPPEPHSLHGLGWLQPWTVTREAGF